MGSTIPKAILRKDLDYKSIVLYSGISMTLISVGKLVSAWAGLGMYSLVVPQAIVSPFLMFSFFFKTKWVPSLNLGYKYFNDIFSYTKHIIGGRILTRLVNDGDNLIVGKFVGMEGLGIYALAFQLANLVTTNIVFLANDMVLPVLTKVKNDAARLKNIFLRMIGLLGFITFPLIIALILASEGIIGIIYGDKWTDAILPFQILCIFALSRSINSPTSALFNAKGRPDINFKFALYFTPIFFLSVYLGSLKGVTGVAIATTVCRFLGAFVLVAYALKLIEERWNKLILELKYIGYASGLTFIIFSFFLFDLKTHYQDWIRILAIPVIIYSNVLLYRIMYRLKIVDMLNSIETTTGQAKLVFLMKRFLFIHDQA
jgi:O-antigen/teichoic acid export membrane protein